LDWSPHGVEEGKGQGGLAASHQYGNTLLGVRYQEEVDWPVVSVESCYNKCRQSGLLLTCHIDLLMLFFLEQCSA